MLKKLTKMKKRGPDIKKSFYIIRPVFYTLIKTLFYQTRMGDRHIIIKMLKKFTKMKKVSPDI